MTGEAGEAPPRRRLELVPDQPDQPDELAAALAGGARARDTGGDLRASRESFERAWQLARQAQDAGAMALAALGLAGLWVHEHRTVTGSALLEDRLQQVLPLLDPGSPLALRVRARLAGEAGYARDEQAPVLAVLAEARAAGDPVALAEALSIAHHCLLGPDHLALRRDLAVDLIKESFRTGRRSDLLMGLMWQTVDAYAEGDPHAVRLLGELREELGHRRHRAIGFVASAIGVMLAIRAGDLARAEALVAQCADDGTAAGDADSDWWSGAQLVTIRWYQGRLGELLPALRDRVHAPGLSPVDDSAVAALAVAAALAGDRRTAVSSLATLCGSDLANLPRSSSWLVTMNGIVEAAHLLGDVATAARAYELLVPYARLPMIGSLGITCFGAAEQALGVAALTSGHLDLATGHLRAAVQRNLALAHWPAVIAARQRLAQAYTLRGEDGAARQEWDAAVAEAADLGLPLPAGPARPGAGSAGAVAECRRAGRKWRVAVANRHVLAEDSIGMAHLAVLIANPRQQVRAADLVAGLAALSAAASAGGAGEGEAAQAVLDQEATAGYRSRLRRLDADLEELDASGDAGRAARARAERDWLVAQLASAAGFGGRTRSFPHQEERARVAVGKAIRRAIARISEADPVVGEHLRETVHTGVRCSYWPG